MNATEQTQRNDLVRILGKILRAHDSDNNGAFMGEAHLCQAFASEARDALINAGASSELMQVTKC